MTTKKAAKISERKIKSLVDQLGELRSLMSQAEERENSIRDTLLALGRSEYDGVQYRATVSRSVRFDLDVIALRAGVRRSVWAKYQRKKRVTTLRVTARIMRRRRRK